MAQPRSELQQGLEWTPGETVEYKDMRVIPKKTPIWHPKFGEGVFTSWAGGSDQMNVKWNDATRDSKPMKNSCFLGIASSPSRPVPTSPSSVPPPATPSLPASPEVARDVKARLDFSAATPRPTPPATPTAARLVIDIQNDPVLLAQVEAYFKSLPQASFKLEKLTFYPPSSDPGKEDYLIYLWQRRGLIARALEPLAYNHWPIARARYTSKGQWNWSTFADYKSATEEGLGLPKCCSELEFKPVLTAAEGRQGYTFCDKYSISQWRFKSIFPAVPGVYGTVSYDPLLQKWMRYVGKMKSFTTRWSHVATSTSKSHHRGIYVTLHSILNAVDPKRAVTTDAILADVAYACSIVHAMENNSTEPAVWVFILEEASNAKKDFLRTLESEWIDKLKTQVDGYNRTK